MQIHHRWSPFPLGCMYRGLCFTVEPVVCLQPSELQILADNWSVVAANKLPLVAATAAVAAAAAAAVVTDAAAARADGAAPTAAAACIGAGCCA